MVKTEKLRIEGMTCINCENRIAQVLRSVDGISRVSVSYERGEAEITYDNERITHDKIVAIIEVLDYRVLPDQAKQPSRLWWVVGISIVIVALYEILQVTGVLNLLVPGQLAESGMGYGMLFIIGLMTSVHCIAMCGGINLSQCIPDKESTQLHKKNGRKTVLPALLYNAGRVASYTVMGLILGTVGYLVGGATGGNGISVWLQGILKLVAGLFMVIMGINVLDIFPGLRKFTLRVPRFITRRVSRERAKRTQPLLVGLLNGLMPCGPLQSMWLVALATANPFAGALSMFLFALGTVPLMLGLGSLVSVLGKQFAKQVRLVGAILVVVLGLAMISQGGLLSGWLSPDLLWILILLAAACGILLSIPVNKKTVSYLLRAASLFLIIGTILVWNGYQNRVIAEAAADETASASLESQEKENKTGGQESESGGLENGVQIVRSTLERGQYPTITVEAGTPVKWIIDAPEGSINGCNYRMYISDYDITYTFQEGENVIEFTPTTAGTVSYHCWMGMIYGMIQVTEPGEEAPELSETDSNVSVNTVGSCCGSGSQSTAGSCCQTGDEEIDWDSLPKLADPCCE